MEFVLVGAHQGRTMKLGGFRFVDGVVDVDAEAKDAHSLLRNFYQAYPCHEVKIGPNGEFTLMGSGPEPMSFRQVFAAAIPGPAVLPVPGAPVDLGDDVELDDAGGLKPKPAKPAKTAKP